MNVGVRQGGGIFNNIMLLNFPPSSSCCHTRDQLTEVEVIVSDGFKTKMWSYHFFCWHDGADKSQQKGTQRNLTSFVSFLFCLRVWRMKFHQNHLQQWSTSFHLTGANCHHHLMLTHPQLDAVWCPDVSLHHWSIYLIVVYVSTTILIAAYCRIHFSHITSRSQ